MHYGVEFCSNFNIDFITVSIAIIIRWLLSDSAGHFWWTLEFENVANPDFENIKHLQNPGHLLLTKPGILTSQDSARLLQ